MLKIDINYTIELNKKLIYLSNCSRDLDIKLTWMLNREIVTNRIIFMTYKSTMSFTVVYITRNYFVRKSNKFRNIREQNMN